MTDNGNNNTIALQEIHHSGSEVVIKESDQFSNDCNTNTNEPKNYYNSKNINSSLTGVNQQHDQLKDNITYQYCRTETTGELVNNGKGASVIMNNNNQRTVQESLPIENQPVKLEYADESVFNKTDYVPCQPEQQPPSNAYGMLRHGSDILYITEKSVDIGRNSSTSMVHFNIAKNSFVSRKHFQVIFDDVTCEFYLLCSSKNGIFVNDVFQRQTNDPVKLPSNSNFRFPNTDIRIIFESYINSKTNVEKISDDGNELPPEIKHQNASAAFCPLKINIPKLEHKSPFPSPTGTISAANSRPTSPRQGFQDYQNYTSRSLQSENLFQPPSTSSYNEHEKPPYSYAQLIVQSISAAPDKQLTLSDIYYFISKHYPYYRKEANKGWQNSIRHNLSLNRYFIKVARSQDEPGKGSYWRIDPNSEAKLIDQSYKKRRRQRGSQGFKPSFGMPRSAPVSPTHMDNSRENSPVHDIVLQSAPNSPGAYRNHSENNHSLEDISGFGTPSMQRSPYSHNYQGQFNLPPPTTQLAINNSSSSSSGQTLTISAATVTGGISGPAVNSMSGQQPLKRLHPATSTTTSRNSDMYDEMQDYGGAAGSSDECDVIKRPKYIAEVNQ